MTASREVGGGRAELDRMLARFGRLFGRAEPREQAGRYLEGLLGPVERKNGWQLAEHLGDARPWRTQRVLSHVLWDEEAARDLCRDYVVEHLGDPEAVLVVDETGFVKKGRHSAGVARQYCGTVGKVENCQIGVFLAYASREGQALIDRRLYLPEAWAGDAERRRPAKVPGDVPFLTTPEIACEMLARALDAGVPCAWVLGDEVYGADRRLRLMPEGRGKPYLLGIRGNDPVRVTAGSGARRRTSPRRCRRTLGSAAAPARGAKGSAFTTGRACPWRSRTRRPWAARHGSAGSWSGGRSPIPRSWPTSSCPARPGCGSRTGRGWRGDAGPWRGASRPPSRRWAWPTTRCGAGTAGTGTSRWPCWRSPSWPRCGPG
jgi:SRSO17 transposase